VYPVVVDGVRRRTCFVTNSEREQGARGRVPTMILSMGKLTLTLSPNPRT